MKITYCIVQNVYHLESSGRISYGIAVVEEADTEPTVLCTIPDISTKQADIEYLVEKCNQLQLSPLHIRDIVEDFIS